MFWCGAEAIALLSFDLLQNPKPPSSFSVTGISEPTFPLDSCLRQQGCAAGRAKLFVELLLSFLAWLPRLGFFSALLPVAFPCGQQAVLCICSAHLPLHTFTNDCSSTGKTQSGCRVLIQVFTGSWQLAITCLPLPVQR